MVTLQILLLYFDLLIIASLEYSKSKCIWYIMTVKAENHVCDRCLCLF